jgi:hypothetical protein
MKSRFLGSVLVIAAAFAAPAAAQDQGPAITAQAAPLGKILADVKATIKLVAGPAADDVLKAFDEKMKEGLGEKGFTGIDMTRPTAGYVEIKDPAEKSYGVIVIPVTSEDEFKDLLTRIVPDDPLELDPVDGKKGLYAIESKKGESDVPVRLRFKGGHAYIGINAPDDALAADKLVPVADLVGSEESALFAYRGYVTRYPESLKKQAFEAIEKAVEQADDSPLPDAAKAAVKDLVGWYKRIAEQSIVEGDTAAYRIHLDPRTGEVTIESGLTAKKGTPLAKDIAARKPTVNRFAGLIGEDTAGGFVLQLPLFAAELRDAAVVGLKEAKKQADGHVPEEYKAVADEAFAGVIRTVQGGQFDLAAAVTGPDKNGLFSAAVGVSFEDTAELEKLLRKLHAGAPEEIQNMIKLDAAKVGEVAVHRVPIGLFLPPEAKKAFGDKASVALAFAPKGIYLTFGPDSLAAMKAALENKPAEAKALDVLLNPVRAGKLMTAVAKPGTEQDQRMIQNVFGGDDRLVSVYSFAVEGGKELKLRFAVNLVPFGRTMLLGAGVKPAPAE